MQRSTRIVGGAVLLGTVLFSAWAVYVFAGPSIAQSRRERREAIQRSQEREQAQQRFSRKAAEANAKALDQWAREQVKLSRSGAAYAPTAPSAEQKLRAREQDDRSKAQAYLDELLQSGAVEKVELDVGYVWVDPLVWAMMNRDQKERFIVRMSFICDTLAHAPAVRIKSYSDDAVLGKYGMLGAKILR